MEFFVAFLSIRVHPRLSAVPIFVFLRVLLRALCAFAVMFMFPVNHHSSINTNDNIICELYNANHEHHGS
jgi:hypothetical protein